MPDKKAASLYDYLIQHGLGLQGASDEDEEADKSTPDTPDPSDPQAEAPATETDESTGSEAQPAQDYEKRYNDLRPEHDRNTARLNQFETFYENLTNPDTQGQALQALGLELDGEDSDEDDYTDPDDRVDRIEQFLTQQVEEQRDAEVADLEDQFFDQELSQLPDGLSEEERDIVVNLAYSIEDDEGLPDVQAAFKFLQGAEEEARKRYTETKKAPRVDIGAAGDKKIDLNNDEARINWFADAIEAGNQD